MTKLKFSSATLRIFLSITGFLITLVYYVLRASGTMYVGISSVINIFALCLALFAVWTLTDVMGKNTKQTGFKIVMAGIFFTLIGQVAWTLSSLMPSIQLPAVLPTILFLVTYVLTFVGYIVIAYASKVDLKEFLGMVVGIGILGAVLITLSIAVHPISRLNIINLSMVIGDSLRVIIISLILQMVVLYHGGLFGRFWLSIFIGNLYILIGDFAASVFAGQYFTWVWPFTLIDIIYLGGYFFVTHGFYGLAEGVYLAQLKILQHKNKKS